MCHGHLLVIVKLFFFLVQLFFSNDSLRNEGHVSNIDVEKPREAIDPQITFLLRRRVKRVRPGIGLEFEAPLPIDGEMVVLAWLTNIVNANHITLFNPFVLLGDRQFLYLNKTLLVRDNEVAFVKLLHREKTRFVSRLFEVASTGSLLVEQGA